MIRFWVSSSAALAAAIMLSLHLNLLWWQGFMLWVALDIMTAGTAPKQES